MAIPTGLTLEVVASGSAGGLQYVQFVGSGTYTAADFTVTAEAQYTNNDVPTLATQLTYGGLGFEPKKVLVSNLTDKTETLAYLGSDVVALATTGLKTIANGTRTYAAHGVSATGRSLTVTVATAGPVTTNCVFVIECWG